MKPLDNALLFLLTSMLIAITAVVYSYVLTQPGEIFAGLYKRLDTWFKTDERQMKFGKGPHPLFKLLIWCEKCVAGQWSLWIFLICAWPWYQRGYLILIIPHVLFIGLTIFLALCIKKFYRSNIES